MWLRVALDKDSLIQNSEGYSYVDGEHYLEYYFDDDIASLLEKDGFLTEIWENLDSVADWGDCDTFFPDKCLKLIPWLQDRIASQGNEKIMQVYNIMLDYAQKAVKYNTAMDLDF